MHSNRGFSLVEMMVAVGLFAIVMVICTSTLFALVNANRKAQSLQSVMNNLNVALDGIARAIRMGSAYHCGESMGTENLTLTRDCNTSTGGTFFIFEKYGGIRNNFADQWFYVYDTDGSICGVRAICKSESGGAANSFFPLTAPEVQIDSMTFYTVGTTRTDATQPKVVIVLKGTAGAANVKTRSTFHIQVGATQRLIDL